MGEMLVVGFIGWGGGGLNHFFIPENWGKDAN